MFYLNSPNSACTKGYFIRIKVINQGAARLPCWPVFVAVSQTFAGFRRFWWLVSPLLVAGFRRFWWPVSPLLVAGFAAFGGWFRRFWWPVLIAQMYASIAQIDAQIDRTTRASIAQIDAQNDAQHD